MDPSSKHKLLFKEKLKSLKGKNIKFIVKPSLEDKTVVEPVSEPTTTTVPEAPSAPEEKVETTSPVIQEVSSVSTISTVVTPDTTPEIPSATSLQVTPDSNLNKAVIVPEAPPAPEEKVETPVPVTQEVSPVSTSSTPVNEWTKTWSPPTSSAVSPHTPFHYSPTETKESPTELMFDRTAKSTGTGTGYGMNGDISQVTIFEEGAEVKDATTILFDQSKKIDFKEKSNTFTYTPDFDTLSPDLSELGDISDINKVFVLPYKVNNYGLKPFLEFGLFKDEDKDTLSFFTLSRSDFERVGLKKKIAEVVYGTELQCGLKTFDTMCFYRYYTKDTEGNVYILLDVGKPSTFIPSKSYQVLNKNKDSNIWWGLVTEIINHRKIVTLNVKQDVTQFFLNNPSMLYLRDKYDDVVETPEVGYHGTYYGLLDLVSQYGLRPSTLYPMMGPYFYLGTFRKAVRYAGWTSTSKPRLVNGEAVTDEKGKYKRGGIARFAMFLGKMKVFTNHPQDPDDVSHLVRERIKDSKRRDYEELTLKLHDHNGKWAKHYDSAYVGKAKLSNGGLFMKNPEFILKRFEQQYLLSTHELDMTTLKDKWDPVYEKYDIM